MLTTKFMLLGLALPLFGAMFVFVGLENSSAKFVPLSEETMGQLVGGSYTRSGTQNSASGSKATCSTSHCPKGNKTYTVAYYGCPVCYSGQKIYTKESFDWKFKSSCGVDEMPGDCPVKNRAWRTKERCETLTSSTC